VLPQRSRELFPALLPGRPGQAQQRGKREIGVRRAGQCLDQVRVIGADSEKAQRALGRCRIVEAGTREMRRDGRRTFRNRHDP
jgi:hypothetical protein